MNEVQPRRLVSRQFSLRHLLTLTTLIAIGVSVAMTYQKNRSMVQYRDELLSLSSQSYNMTEGKLTSAEMPKLADDFQSWHVHIPNGNDYELRLGIGPVSEVDLPPIVGAVTIPAGQHRVTLHTGDSPDEEFRYVVYVDGQPVIDKTMGRQWIPGGWSSAHGLSWRADHELDSARLQLSSQSYHTRPDLGSGNYFNGQSDNYVTRSGYRLWIDRRDRTLESVSPFMGLTDASRFYGIGLRDGLRYRSTNGPPYDWTFTRPQLDTNEPIWRIAAEFSAEDGRRLTSQTKSFQSWQLRDDALGENPLNWKADPTKSVYSAFLQAKHGSKETPQPVMEMQWDANRPDEVGIRIADSPANQAVQRWRLRIFDGTKHLWREMQIGDRLIKADKVVDDDGPQPTNATITLDHQESTTEDIRIQWQTDEALPLQVLERQQINSTGIKLYEGLPLTFGIQIPTSLQPTLQVYTVSEDPINPGKPFFGGTVFDEIQIDLDATKHDWIWLKTTPRLRSMDEPSAVIEDPS